MHSKAGTYIWLAANWYAVTSDAKTTAAYITLAKFATNKLSCEVAATPYLPITPQAHTTLDCSPVHQYSFITATRRHSLHTISQPSHLARESGTIRTDPLWRSPHPLIPREPAGRSAPQRIRRLLALARTLGLSRAQLLARPTYTQPHVRDSARFLPSLGAAGDGGPAGITSSSSSCCSHARWRRRSREENPKGESMSRPTISGVVEGQPHTTGTAGPPPMTTDQHSSTAPTRILVPVPLPELWHPQRHASYLKFLAQEDRGLGAYVFFFFCLLFSFFFFCISRGRPLLLFLCEHNAKTFFF